MISMTVVGYPFSVGNACTSKYSVRIMFEGTWPSPGATLKPNLPSPNPFGASDTLTLTLTLLDNSLGIRQPSKRGRKPGSGLGRGRGRPKKVEV